MSRLSNKVAIVTGASKGIGGGIATALGAAGARVAVNYSSERKGAERIVQAIIGSGGEAIAVGADVSKAARCRATIQRSGFRIWKTGRSGQQRRGIPLQYLHGNYSGKLSPPLQHQCSRNDSPPTTPAPSGTPLDASTSISRPWLLIAPRLYGSRSKVLRSIGNVGPPFKLRSHSRGGRRRVHLNLLPSPSH